MKKVQLLASALYFASIGAHLQERTTTLNGSCSTGDASAPNHGAYSMLEMDKIVRAYSSPELDGQVLTLAPKQSDASHCIARETCQICLYNTASTGTAEVNISYLQLAHTIDAIEDQQSATAVLGTRQSCCNETASSTWYVPGTDSDGHTLANVENWHSFGGIRPVPGSDVVFVLTKGTDYKEGQPLPACPSLPSPCNVYGAPTSTSSGPI